MAQYYDLFRALHLISVLAWSAALLMMPRFFAYQTEAAPAGEVDQLMVKAADRLMRFIMNPAMLASWLFGISLIIARFSAEKWPLWLFGKLVLALALTVYHLFLSRHRRLLAKGQRTHSGKFWRIMNEIPFLIMIGIVLLVVMEPG